MDEVKILEQPIEHKRNTLTAFIITIIFIAIILVTVFKINLSGNTLIIVIVLEMAFYFSIAVMLLEPKGIMRIMKTIIKKEDRAVVQQVSTIREVQVPVVKEVPVDRPVYIEKIVDRPVYVQMPRKKLNIPHYDFIGSSQTRTYHSRKCRLGKLIKKKYKISDNSEIYFKKHKFSPCMVCIQKLKKV